MDIKTFVDVVSSLPPHIAVLAKGPTGIGKSHIVHQVAKNLGFPVLDKRLAYMTEGDVVGLPELVDGVTRFAPVDWIVKACNEPVVLFLDELNRATIEVQQCAFQLVLDRELNGNYLHPDTRVYVAVNEGSDYQVTEMDPALLRRFYVADLIPTTNDWLTWANNNDEIDDILVEYIERYPAHLRHTGEFTPGTVYPNPASWHRLCQSLTYANMAPSEMLGENYNSIVLSIAKGFVGETTAISFVSFLKEYQTTFTPEDVFLKYDDDKKLTKQIDKLTNDKKNNLLRQIASYSSKNDLELVMVRRACKFAEKCSDEMLVNFMYLILDTKHVTNIRYYHSIIGKKVTNKVNALTNS